MKKQVDLGLLGSDCVDIGVKRCSDELGDKQESVRKHSVLSSQVGKIERAIKVTGPLDLNTDLNNGIREKYDTKHNDVKKRATWEKRILETTSGGIGIGFGLDLNAEDLSFCSSKTGDHLTRDASECGSTTEEKERDSLRVFKKMKENGFLGNSIQSSLNSNPKQRGRKSKSDFLKKKMELAKKEQVDRFTKITAPSGLLNELNPGIINHVRNKKQVHSIIEALVRSEKDGETIQDRHQTVETKQMNHYRDSTSHRIGTMVSGSRQIGAGCHVLTRGSLFSSVDNREALALKLSSTKNVESTDGNSISCLSGKAASVASQWLELLYQDTKGHISVWQRSRKRVQAESLLKGVKEMHMQCDKGNTVRAAAASIYSTCSFLMSKENVSCFRSF